MRTAKNMSCSKIIRRRRREAETRNGYIQLLARIILVIVCGGLLFTQGFLLMRAPDNGMFPAIKGGDLLIGFRLQRNFLKNDVVVYKANGKLQVGRILGQETDVITIDDTGQLLVNRRFIVCSFYFVMGLIFIGRKWKGKAENTLFMAISSSAHGSVS